MGIFDFLGGGSSSSGRGSIFGGGSEIFPLRTPDKTPDISKIMEQTKKDRKKIEDAAEKINPALGKYVRATNNLGDTLENARDSLQNGIIRAIFSPEVKELELADHLYVQRIGYTHHGLYIGDRKVVHYLRSSIQIDSLETFADGAKIHKKSISESPLEYSKREAINRGTSRCGEDKYNLFLNNCENFVRWCRAGGKEL